MPVSVQDLAAQDAAYAKAGNDAQTAEQARQTLGAQGQPKGILSWMTQMPQRITGDMIDSAVHAADSMAHDGSWGEAATRVGRDVAAAAASAVKNTAGAAVDFANAMDNGRAEKDLAETGGKGMSQREMQRALEAEDPAMEARDRAMGDSAEQLDYGQNPIWNHARQAILDFRDAVAVKDPNLVDNLTQSVAQLAIPFAGYSRALGEVHTFADMASESPKLVQFGAKMLDEALATTRAGAVTDATALSPHSMRFADLIALGRHTEGKLGEALRAIDPSGSAQDAYIRYLTDRDDEGAAEGRFKNVLDGLTVNNLVTPLLTAAGSVLKQGTAGLRYLIDNGAASAGDIAGIRSPQMQRGAVGDLKMKRPPLRQNYDPAADLYDEQVRRDADAAHRALPPPVQFSNENGLIKVESPNGLTHARPTGEGNWRIFKSETSKEARGNGEGYARLKRGADEAHTHGVLLESDHQVSAPEARLYARLKAEGYHVRQNPFERDPGTGELRSTSELKPVFVVGPGEMH